MKLLKLKFKIIIGVVLFILIIGAYYCASIFNFSSKTTQNFSNKLVYNGKFLIPIENFIAVTSKYGMREAHGVVHSNHTGIDLCGSIGSKVLSVRYGEVTWAGWQNNGYGNCVEIRHTGENGEIFYTFYAHMRDDSICVSKGQTVVEGQVIGIQGTTGNSTGDHLHFEIRKSSGTNKDTIDPAPYLFREKED